MTAHDVPGGAAWSLRVRPGREVRFTALGPGACCSLLLLTSDGDRLNVPDTLKAQMSARIAPPMVLMSDRGVGLASVTGSSLDWHDALCGHSTDRHVTSHASYQEHRNDRRVSARTGLLSELRKRGFDRTDLHASVNLFSKVAVAADGALSLVTDHCAADDWVTLRTEVELLLVMSTSPHPLDLEWKPADVRVTVTAAPPDDGPRLSRAESARALDAAREVLA
ncbi:MAG: urea carboxylase-associated protein 2 [Frankiales bacterium]|nr:urea carboxylase-associated protein 2 [Frankiales bacterium]